MTNRPFGRSGSHADFLLPCLASALLEDASVPVSDLRDDAWRHLVGEALRLGVGPLFHGAVEPRAVEWGVPPEDLARLRAVYAWSASRRGRALRQMAELLPAFRAAGVPVIALKGIHTGEALYPDPARRFLADIDLLLRARDLERGAGLLRSLGYRLDHARDDGDRSKHLPPFVRQNALAVELHHDLVPAGRPASLDIDRMWRDSRSARIAGEAVNVLSPEDTLLHACVHVAHNHKFVGALPGLCDVALILDRWGLTLDWERTEEISREGGAHAYVRCTLRLALDLFGGSSPAAASTRFPSEPGDHELLGALRDVILERPGLPEELPEVYKGVRRSRGVTAKARVLFGALFPAPVRLRELEGEPEGLGVYRHYLTRPARFLAREWRTLAAIALRSARLAPAFERERRSRVLSEWFERAAAEARGE